MRTRDEIEQEVEMTLQSADNFTRYGGKPFLMTRVKARLNKETEVKPGFFHRLVLQPYLLAFILLLNVFSAVYFFSDSTSIDQNRDQYIDQLADELSISGNNYDLNTLIGEE